MRKLSLLLGLALLLTTCKTYQSATAAKTTSDRMDMGRAAPEDHPVAAIIAPYKVELDEQMEVVIGEVANTLTKQRPESALGNWAADAVMAHARTLSRRNISATTLNHGGLRLNELAAGPITKSKIYELMPFDNTLVIIDMEGKMAQRFFNHVAAQGGWPVSSEVQFVMKEDKARRLTIQRRVLLANETYRIAMPDYIANGGDNCDFLGDLPREDTGVLIRDILLQTVEELTAAGKMVDGKVTGRISWSGGGNE